MKLREKILAKKNLQRESIFVPEWNETIYIRSLTAYERCMLETRAKEKNEANESLAILIFALIWCCEDDAGQRIFLDSDYDAITQIDGVVAHRLFELVAKVNRLTQEDVEAVKKK